MRIDAAIFPFNERMLPLVRHFNQMQNRYWIRKVIAWSGLGLNGRDVAFVCRHPALGIPVVPPDDPSDAEWKILIVDDDELANSFALDRDFDYLRECLNVGKRIVLVGSDESALESNVRWGQLSKEYPGEIELYSNCTGITETDKYIAEQYRQISVPTILIGGLTQTGDELEILLSLRDTMKRHGASVSCLAESCVGNLLGVFSYRHIFGEHCALTNSERALRLNKFAQEIVWKEHPDFLLVEAPDAMMKYNSNTPNGFGIQTYMVSQSLEPDTIICSVPVDLAAGDFIEVLSNDFQGRYGCAIGAVHVSNSIIDSMGTVRDRSVQCVHVEMKKVYDTLCNARKTEMPVAIFDAISEGTEDLYSKIIS